MTAPSLSRLAAVLLLWATIDLTAQTGVVWSAGPYAYDGAGNIKSIGPADTFVYDKFGRLMSGTAGAGHLQEYTYDTRGNILSVTTDSSTGTALKPCVDPATNQIDGNPSGCNALGAYGVTGNMESYGSYATFAYDQLDMVKESTVDGVRKLHLYGATDERIASIAVVGTTPGAAEWTVRDVEGRVLRRFHRTSAGAWNWKEDYVYGDGSLMAAEVSGSERTMHFHLDHLGSPRLITGSGGAEIARHDYFPFGREATSSAQDAEPLKFTGHERDDKNLDYMRARYYMPFTGRFLSPDPILGNLMQPGSWNRYAYVFNNPMMLVDPLGLAPKKKKKSSEAPGDLQCSYEGGILICEVIVPGQKPKPTKGPVIPASVWWWAYERARKGKHEVENWAYLEPSDFIAAYDDRAPCKDYWQRVEDNFLAANLAKSGGLGPRHIPLAIGLSGGAKVASQTTGLPTWMQALSARGGMMVHGQALSRFETLVAARAGGTLHGTMIFLAYEGGIGLGSLASAVGQHGCFD